MSDVIIAHKCQYLRLDQYLAGFDHFEDDHALYVCYKSHVIGIFPSGSPQSTKENFRDCADQYQAALERMNLGKEGIVFERTEARK